MSYDVEFWHASEAVKAKKAELDKARTTNEILDIMNDILGNHGFGMTLNQESALGVKYVSSAITVYSRNDPQQQTWKSATAPLNQRTSKGFERAMVNSLRQAIYKCFNVLTDN